MIAQLRALLRPDQILTETVDLIPYGFDGTAMLKEKANAVVFPETTEEVAAIVKLAYKEKTPIVTRGSGTGLSGGSIPVKNGIVLCLVKMNRILEIDTKNLTLTAEAGTITQAIDDAAAAEGLIYPPDPGSMKISTIGGNVANNSGGLRGLKYGVTRNYVMGMEVVLPNGDIAWLGNKCVKDVAGYSLKDLFIGSEGTLGIVTKVLLRLLPRPEARKTILATFNDIEDAAQTVSDIIAAKIIPCTLEFLDQTTIRCVEDFAKIGLPTEAKALLLMESDGPASAVEEEAQKMQAIAQSNRALSLRVAANSEEAVQLATARRSAFSALARIRPTTILEDVTVPRSKLAATVRFIESVAQKHGLKIANFGHMGDGNLHPTFLTNERDGEEIERVEKAMHEIFEYTIAAGGTITGEHGVGLAKKGHLPDQFADASYPLLQSIKRSLDPEQLLNPGKLFDL
ncbi:FAD-linked oxidase C-terminal domain-containing protein [Pelagicoccus enzymogenes]|uniref:FAD-binding oxidoreductase n=1 Tax=Pelagicoccus enzymogenes TaxID=2773457 RepID=UPI00280CA7F6|nr:FAD-linked oxidase C-terminal domain-containing protein [Pelagicoccus enzymogenes]MDQ8200153.1 FAD-linked oxidase C-terminal domain-containing protein [Pelagicoccus enzymogenes]